MGFPPPPPNGPTPPGQGGGFGPPQGYGPPTPPPPPGDGGYGYPQGGYGPPNPPGPPVPPGGGYGGWYQGPGGPYPPPGGGNGGRNAAIAIAGVVLAAAVIGGVVLIGSNTQEDTADDSPTGTVTATTPTETATPTETDPFPTVEPTTASPAPDFVRYVVLDPGQCFDSPGIGGEVTQVTDRSCSSPHDAEVIANKTLSGGFTSDLEIQKEALALCKPEASKRIPSDGRDYYNYALFPKLETYKYQHRNKITCSLSLSDGSNHRKLTKKLP